MPQKPALPPSPAIAPARAPAAHVQAAVGRTAQLKRPEGAPSPPRAPHVQKALAQTAQAKTIPEAPMGRTPGSHVQVAMAAARTPPAVASHAVRQLAPHVQPARVVSPARQGQAVRPGGHPAPAVPGGGIRIAPGPTATPRTGRASPVQKREGPSTAIAQAKNVLQPIGIGGILNWLFPAEKTTEEDYIFSAQGRSETHTVKITEKLTPGGNRDIKIYLGDSAQENLHGQIEGTQGWIQTVARGRFPEGRGFSYLLINLFAKLAKKYGATSVKLGTPVNRASVNAMVADAARRGVNVNVEGERAALHVYTGLGYDVSTRESASESSRTPQQLITGTGAKIGNWVSVDELASAASSAIEQAIMSFF